MLLRFVAKVDQISSARAAAADTLIAWGMPGLVDDAELVASELLTNGLIASGETVIMNLTRERKGVVIAVWDSCPRLPVVRCPGHLAEIGRGLHIVSALSSEHGCDRADSGGKVVWARLPIAN
jgi:anti-sigma regulatory factor (Ser/Thr protein kinase)